MALPTGVLKRALKWRSLGFDDQRSSNKSAGRANLPVGLCLHQGSDKGMDLLRTFLEPQGMLEQWLTKNSYSNDLKRTLVAATGSKGDIKSWATKKRQTMERAFLSGKLGKDVKSFKGLEAELTLLREQVSKRAAIFKN